MYLVWRHPSEGGWGVGGQAAVAGLLVAGVPAVCTVLAGNSTLCQVGSGQWAVNLKQPWVLISLLLAAT